MDNNRFYKDGLHFSCRRCSVCCGKSPGFVYLSRADLERLCAFCGLTITAFIQTYCRWADYYHGTQVLALKEQKNYDCILWNGGCSVYNARPIQCSTYPFWSWMLKDQKTWNDCAKDCPGMNGGKLWTYDEISKNERAYARNQPLLRKDAEYLMKQENGQIE